LGCTPSDYVPEGLSAATMVSAGEQEPSFYDDMIRRDERTELSEERLRAIIVSIADHY
jgi:hypothetical protein